MIFLKEKGIAILFLSVIFTLSSVMWTSDVVLSQADMGSIKLGWPIDFLIQDRSQLDPPTWWFPHNMGLGLPQEYAIITFRFPLFLFDVTINFLIILAILFSVLKFNPKLYFLAKVISAKYIAGTIGLISILLISFVTFDGHTNKLRIGAGIPSPMEMPPTPLARINNLNEVLIYLKKEPQTIAEIPEWKTYTSEKLG